MKKILALMLAAALALSMVACGGGGTGDTSSNKGGDNVAPSNSSSTNTDESNTQPTIEPTGEKTYVLGDTAASDILEFTLDNATFAIALGNVLDDNYFLPREYYAVKDAKNPYVASKGHTLVAITYTVNNLDRTGIAFDTLTEPFFSVTYNGESISPVTVYGYVRTDGGDWAKYDRSYSSMSLSTGEKKTLRCYLDIPMEAIVLTDTFDLTVHLPCSDSSTQDAVFTVTEEARSQYENQELSLEDAIARFIKADGQEYFKNHMEEYSVLSADEIQTILFQKEWSVKYVVTGMSWEGNFKFDEDGKIEDTYGYANERTWKLESNMLVFNEKYSCEMRQVLDGVYLMVCEGNPYMIML